MKIMRRVLIIALAFTIFAGLMVVVVDASGANAPGFGDSPQFRPEGNAGDANRPERGEGFGVGPRWLAGVIKNVGVIALLVTMIVWPKSIARKNKKKAALKSSSE